MKQFFRPTNSLASGFSLIELLVTISIIVVISTIGLVSYSRASLNARDAKRKSDLEAVRQALVLYRTENTAYPAPLNNNSEASFTTMLGTLRTQTYLNDANIADPKDTTTGYGYRYFTATGASFQLCALLEGTAADYCVYSP